MSGRKREEHKIEEILLMDKRDIPEDEMQRLKELEDKAREDAIKALQEGSAGFAVFVLTSKETKEGKKTGVQSIMAGGMNLPDTMTLVGAMHEICMNVVDGVEEQLHGAMYAIKKRKGAKRGKK